MATGALKLLKPDPKVTVTEARGLDIDSPAQPEARVHDLKSPKFNDSRALKIVANRWHVGDDYRRPYEEKWARWQAQYRQVVKRARDGSNLPSDEPFTVVETVLPRVISAIFSMDPPFGVRPVDPASDLHVDLIRDLLAFQWQGKMDMVPFLTNFFKSALKFGTAVAKIIWEQDWTEDYFEVPERDAQGLETGRTMGRIIAKQSYDGPKLVFIPLYNFWIEPHAKSIEEADWVIAEHWVPEPVLRELEREGIYHGVEELKYMRDAGDADQAKLYQSASAYGGYGQDYMLKRSGRQSPFDYQDAYSPMVKIWEYYGSYYDEQNRRFPNRLITVADEKVVLRHVANPFSPQRKPFVEARPQIDELEFYGLGLLEVLEPAMTAHQALNNMVQDNLAYAIQKMFLVARGARLPANSIRFRPFGVIPVEDINAIKQLEVNDVVPSALAQRAWLEQRIQNLTGTTDYLRGMNTGVGSDTATGITQGIRQSNLRFDLMLRSLKSFLTDVLNQQHALNKQFLSVGQVIRIKGEEGYLWKRVSHRDIGANVDFAILGDDQSADDFAAQQRLLLMFDKLLLDPQLRQVIDVRGVVEELFKTFKIKGYDRLMLDVARYKDIAYLSQDPAEELYRAMRGEPMVVRPGDDHHYHGAIHTEQYYTAPPHLRPMIAQHLQEHKEAERANLQGNNMALMSMGQGIPMGGGAGGGMGAQPPPGAPAMPVGGAGGQQQTPMAGGSTAGLPIGTGLQQTKAMTG